MIKLFSKQNCHLCDIAKEELHSIKGLTFKEIDIYENDELVEKYGLMIPVVVLDEEIIQYGQIKKEYIFNFLNTKYRLNDINHG